MTAFSAAAGSSVPTIQISNVRAWLAVGSADTRTKIAPAMLSLPRPLAYSAPRPRCFAVFKSTGAAATGFPSSDASGGAPQRFEKHARGDVEALARGTIE